MRTTLKTFCCLLLAGGLSMAVAANPADAAERKIKLNNSAWATMDHPITVWFSIEPCKLLNLVAGDKFDVRIHPSYTLVGMKDSYQAVITGMTPFNMTQPSATPGAFPLMDLFALPGLFANQATSNMVMRELMATYPQFEAELNPAVVRVSSQVHMRADLHTRTPIRSLADLKGKTIGCQSPELAEALSLLGASVSVIDIPDMYTSVDKGIVDGVACAWGSVSMTRLYEVAHYHSLIGVCPLATYFLANRKMVWDVLSPDQQALMRALEPTFQSMIAKGNVESSMDVRFNQATSDKGHQYIEWSQEDMAAARAAFRPLWDRWAEKMEAEGIPGKAILEDAIRLLDAYNYG